jgi:hypothetical protein
MTAVTKTFPRGVLRPELFVGVVSGVSASSARVNLTSAARPTAAHFEASRYGRGEVGELVLVEGQVDLVLGRLVDVQLAEGDKRAAGASGSVPGAEGRLQFLGAIRPDTLHITPGIGTYPRIGDRVYAAPHDLVGRIPELMNSCGDRDGIALHLGHVSGRGESPVRVRPEKLFGRHCAVLGATGGGKSWTVARLVEESARHGGKVILLDATGEYRSMGPPDRVVHAHMGDDLQLAVGSQPCSMPATSFIESDFIALFQPSGKVQGPKLREAIKSLRLVALAPHLANAQGVLIKANAQQGPWLQALQIHFGPIEDPSTTFNATILAAQVSAECVFPDGRVQGAWGGKNDTEYTYCLSLMTRIQSIVTSRAFAPVFKPPLGSVAMDDVVTAFLANDSKRVLRVCLGGLHHEFRTRELIVNALGRQLLRRARDGAFRAAPLLVVVDEAHTFLGRSIGDEDAAVRLDAFELIAREGRKYGLNLCLATQRPRDLTESVLSQIGTLIVHRLTNDRDRDVVERACGEIDRDATAFLANLRQGEAAVVGIDFPIPLTVEIAAPTYHPESDGPDYQRAWGKGLGVGKT